MPSPTCPRCTTGRLHSNGKTSSGAQRLRCKSCGFTLTVSLSGHGGHRHGTVGGTPAAERMRKVRERLLVLLALRKQQQQPEDL